jgi:acetylornithine deacetylase
MSSYPPSCKIGLERRTLPGESAAFVEAELEERLDECRRRDPALEATSRTLLVREPFEADAEGELVRTVGESAAEVLGERPARIGASFWADSAFIAAAGVPTVLFGPAGEGAHAEEEWVSVSSCEQVARVLTAVAARVCA